MAAKDEDSRTTIHNPAAVTAVCKAEALFGNDVPKIKGYAEESKSYSTMAKRNASVVAAILEEFLIMSDEMDDLTDSFLKLLKPYKIAYRHFENAFSKIKDGIYERSVVDDMRAALEALVRDFTRKDGSFEAQISYLDAILDKKHIRSEIKNLYHSITGYFTKYQHDYPNSYDEVDSVEVLFVFDTLGVFMRYIINLLESKKLYRLWRRGIHDADKGRSN